MSKLPTRFDRIVSFSALHWFFDQEMLLDRLHQLLKPEGKILFTIPCNPLEPMQRFASELIKLPRWSSYFETYTHPRRKFTAEEYATLLDAAGFVNIDVQVVRHCYRFETKRDLMQWFEGFAPVILTIPKHEHEAFLTDFANLYEEHFPLDDEGFLPFTQDELLINAERAGSSTFGLTTRH